MTSQGPLTAFLLSSTPNALKRATTHPFLASAGHGTLPKPRLSQWLSQDRLYAQSYIRFIGLLLSKIRLPSQNPSKPATPEQNAITVLIDALVNIRTELAFFEKTAADYNLDLTAISPEEGGCKLTSCGSGSDITTSAGISTSGSGSCPGSTGGPGNGDYVEGTAPGHGLCISQGECQMPGGEVCAPGSQVESRRVEPERCGTIFFCASRTTRAYIDMFMSAGSSGVSVLEGLAVLWATEVCYLRSWRFAARCMGEDGERDYKKDADGGALRERFIGNWSSVEFEEFVDRIGDVVDEMAGQIKGAEELEIMRGRCLEWWRQIVWLEEKFWPNVEC
ncbi:heme oxygenase-like multi-helical [Penicillium cf. griseofulvum]|uniref:Heme oxygenase-like multi-helical n=1 Tax=Penicillium cf. griseofulvum TaxID=2972120 RepID=A0A9W9J130_9EURO|nr:heme oxygenase-like multi-helical [Penicillium cf. griseofulvum]KAJ5434425.1 heme oxygenase-like multi-helical [Penicillium cf. griseofulvum]KAJ5452256.1 heme oxygenase-like multi-helical [Penicillium cf. griseofulvum]